MIALDENWVLPQTRRPEAMTPDVVYYSWVVVDIEYLKVSESIWILTLDLIFFLCYMDN